MYWHFFGFSEEPFTGKSSPGAIYLSPNRQELLATLVEGIQKRRGLMTIVGESHVGKTTLVRAMLKELDESTKAAYVSLSEISCDEIMSVALSDLGFPRWPSACWG